MKHSLQIFFSPEGSAQITVSINQICCYQGDVADLDLSFDISDHNQLSIDFAAVQGQIEILGVCYNHLSIEHFIYQGQFRQAGLQQSQTRTHIDRDGSWVYNFDRDLAKQIIKANT
jgi:hypothetical protein